MLLAVPVALFFLAMGVVALVTPARILRTFGVEVGTPEGRTEVRAVYGGFGIAIGAILFVATVAGDIRDGVFLAVAIALLGMAGGRVASSMMGERAPLWPTWFFFGLEVVLAALLLAALVV